MRLPYLMFGIVAFAVGLSGCMSSVSGPSAELDARDQQLGITCKGIVSVAGALQAGAAAPDDMPGCWGDGTWTFKPTVLANGCAQAAPTLLSQYQFALSHDDDENQVLQYLSSPTDPNAQLRVTAGGGGICEGGLLYFSADGKTVVNLKPVLYADGRLLGQGEYDIYSTDQR